MNKSARQVFNTTIAAGIIFFILFWGMTLYLVNYSNKISQKEKVEFAENRINKLNELYIVFLKSVRDNRGYRLHQDESRKTKYLIYRDSALFLVNKCQNNSAYTQDSILFSKVNELIQIRMANLDDKLAKLQPQPLGIRDKQEIKTTDSLVNELDNNYKKLINYWYSQSRSASESYNKKNNQNDIIFVIWIFNTLLLVVVFIITFRKKINAQLERALTEEKLATKLQKEQEFSAAFDYAAIGMALVSTEGKWLRVNKSLCSFLGYSEEELMNLTFQEITHPDDLNTDLEYLYMMLRKEIDTYQMEKRYFTKHGELVSVLLSVSLVWENEKPKYFISQIQNISNQKALQDKLSIEKSRLQQVIDGTDAGTWEWNVQTGETRFNEKWAQIIGYTLEELSPISIDTWIKYSHPEDLILSNQKLQACFEQRNQQYECACRMKHKSGEWVWVMDRGKVMTWTEDGKPEWMFGSHINITSMKSLEESLALEKQKFITIFNSTFQFIGFLDLDGTLLEINETALNFAGLKPLDVLGKKFWDCHWWQINAETQEQLKNAIQRASKGEQLSYEVVIWDNNKKPTTILFHLKPLRDQYGNVAFIIPEGTIIQDLIDYRTILETKNLELEGFAAIAAHDMKEPLRMISQFMQKLAQKYKDQLDETAQKYILYSVDGANRMSALISDLLAYAEIGGLREDLFEAVDLNEVFDETLMLNAALIEEKNAMVSKTTLPIIRTHKSAMRLLFQNLIGNGLKYQLDGKKPIIQVSCIESDASYAFSLKDNGIGISEINYDKVFDLFSRLHGKSEYMGTGMGLATCKKIVALHKGEIWIESNLAEGTTFYFTIPKQ